MRFDSKESAFWDGHYPDDRVYEYDDGLSYYAIDTCIEFLADEQEHDFEDEQEAKRQVGLTLKAFRVSLRFVLSFD